jgi:hypothetical protein
LRIISKPFLQDDEEVICITGLELLQMIAKDNDSYSEVCIRMRMRETFIVSFIFWYFLTCLETRRYRAQVTIPDASEGNAQGWERSPFSVRLRRSPEVSETRM